MLFGTFALIYVRWLNNMCVIVGYSVQNKKLETSNKKAKGPFGHQGGANYQCVEQAGPTLLPEVQQRLYSQTRSANYIGTKPS